MTRKKVDLVYIENDSARKATFKKRNKGLMKKVHELSTLCAVDACAVIFSPYNPEPDVWPSHLEVQRVISKFKKLPELEQCKKMMSHESFTRERVTKKEEKLKKQEKLNRRNELDHVMSQCLVGAEVEHFHLSLFDLNNLGGLLDQNLRDIEKEIELIKKDGPTQGMTTAQNLQFATNYLPKP